jgi:hypothetical protein
MALPYITSFNIGVWLDKQYLNEYSNIEGYEFLKEEFKKIIELDSTIKFAYLIRFHSTTKHLISQI